MKTGKLIACLLLAMFMGASASGQDIVINEFMAVNNTTVTNELGESPDWIELYNTTGGDIDLAGWHLTDSSNNLVKTVLPATNLFAGAYMIILADKTNAIIDGHIHVDLSLSGGGEYLGIVRPDGNTIEYQYGPEYPEQSSDISYGILADRVNVGFFTNATPGYVNDISGFSGTAEQPVFSSPGGFYTTNLTLDIAVTSPAAVVRYSVNTGQEPTETSPSFGAPLSIQTRTSDANVYSEIQTAPMGAQAQWSWMPKWSPPAGNVFKVTVVRARVYEPGKLPSPIITKTYFVDPNIHDRYPTMPVVSLASDSNHFFHPATGQYVPGDLWTGSAASGNYYAGWTKPTNLEWYDTNGVERIDQVVGTRIQGSTSPGSPHKGLHVVADTMFDEKNRIKYRIFRESNGRAKDANEFKRFMLRGWGSYRGYAYIYDTFAQNLIADWPNVSVDVDMQDYAPVIVFLNGEYWGIHEAREMNKSSWYYQEYMGIDRDDPGYDVLNGRGPYTNDSPGTYSYVMEGDSYHWDRMVEYQLANDMTVPANYEYVQTQMDTKNFIESVVVSCFTMRQDWPDQNETKVRPRTPDGRWRWPVYDCDHSFYEAYNNNMLGQVFADSGRLYPTLKRLMVNTSFSNEFINCYADYMNTYFRQDVMLGQLDSMVGELLPYIQEQQNRWDIEKSGPWEWHIANMYYCVSNRSAFVWTNVINRFSPTTTYPLTIDVSATNEGTIVLNERIEIDDEIPGVSEGSYPWTGLYFDDIPVSLRAVPQRGYEFTGWSGSVTSSSNPVTFYMTNASMSIVANFAVGNPEPIIASEIMFNPADTTNSYNNDDCEFIELYNSGGSSVDMSGYTFTKGITFTFAEGTALGAGQYLVVVKNLDAFATRYSTNGMNIAGEYKECEVAHGTLDNGGERLQLRRTRWGPTVFTFNFNDERGWPVAADGAGHSLIPLVTDDQADGQLDYGGNWRASTYINGSPGAVDPAFTRDIVLNEIVAHTDYTNDTPPFNQYDSDDWIELFNRTAGPISMDYWFLSDDPDELDMWQIPTTNTIAAGGWLTFDEVNGFHSPITTGFGLNKNGETVYLSYLPGDGTDRVVDVLEFEGQENGASIGRYPDGDSSWFILVPTTNAANVMPAEQVVISELMYHPEGRNGINNTVDEYVELYNPTASPVDLWNATGIWRLDGGVEFAFPSNTTIAAKSYVVVVSFNTNDTDLLTSFMDTYSLTNGQVQIFGGYKEALGNDGDSVQLERPQAPDWPSTSKSWVLIDEVIYSDIAPWPTGADGTGSSIRRGHPSVSGNTPGNWLVDAFPSPGLPPAKVAVSAPDHGDNFLVPFATTVSAVVDSDQVVGSLHYVEFFIGTNSLGADNSAPFEAPLSGVTVPGAYTLTAAMVDDSGSNTSAGIVIGVLAVNNAAGATDVTDVSATLNGTMVGFGEAEITIHWGNADGDTNEGTWAYSEYLAVLRPGEFSTQLNGLSAGRYYYRCQLQNAQGESWAESSETFILSFDNWQYSMQIDIDGYDRSSTLTNFPLQVELGEHISGFSYSDLASDEGWDLRFAASTEEALDFEIETWNTNGITYAWVEVPALSQGLGYIKAYWGNSGATEPLPSMLNGSAWGADYEVVMHLAEESGTDVPDSSPNNRTALYSGTNVWQPDGGAIGGGVWMNGTIDDVIQIAGGVSIGAEWAISGWFKDIGERLATETLCGGSTDQHIQIPPRGMNLGTHTGGSFVGSGYDLEPPPGIWNYIVAVGSGGTTEFYHNGVYVNESPAQSSDMVMYVGNWTDGNRFAGYLDEFRVSSQVRSADWIWACWMAAVSNDVLLSYQVLSGVGPVDEDGDGMADDWETNFFTSTNAVNGGRDEDWDSDGINNKDEYIAGTDPTDPGEQLDISIVCPAGSVVVRYNMIEAVGAWYTNRSRYYTLRDSTNLPLGQWNEVSGEVDIFGNGFTREYTNLPAGPVRYYQVRAKLGP